MAGAVRVAVLGDLLVLRDGSRVTVPPGARAAVLVVLSLAAPAPVSRDRMIADIWGEDPPSTAVNALQVHVSALRKVLGADAIVTVGNGYHLGAGVDVDVVTFEELVRRGAEELREHSFERSAATLHEASRCWRGAVFGNVGDAAFVTGAAARLDELRLHAIEMRIDAELSLGRDREFVSELRSLVNDFPYREGFLAQLMVALYRSGRQADALSAYEQGRRRLADDLGLDPSAALRELHHRLLEQTEPVRTEHEPSAVTRVFTAPLPVLLDATVGREPELEALQAMLRNGNRLVSLVGPGGVGKTRTATELAHRSGAEFRDGVVFVPLSDATRADDVATTMCAALGLVVADDATTTLEVALAGRQSLVICDNFEHVLPAAPLLLRLLAAAPALRILVTTRQLLGIRGERSFPMAPLDCDANGEAVELFLTRVRESDPAFVPSVQDRRDAAVIAEKCDGLPLALELAAGRTRVLSLGELCVHLASPLALAAFSHQDRPDRHQSMRNNVAWSVEGLPDGPARFLSSLVVFRGGFTATAAAAVAGVPPEEAFTYLAELCDRSLVQRSATPPGVSRRFDLLVTIREHAAQALTETELESVRARHAHWFRDVLGRPVDAGLPTDDADTWCVKLADRANYREAIRYALESADSVLLGDLVIGAACVWYQGGSRPEITDWLRHVCERADIPERHCDAAIWLAILWGDESPGGQTDRLNSALAIADELGDRRRRAFVLWQLGAQQLQLGDPGPGRAFAEEALREARDLHVPSLEASALCMLGEFAPDSDRALSLYLEGVRIARKQRLDLRLLIFLNNLAEWRLRRGEAREAFECATEGVELAQRAQSVFSLADNLGQRGSASLLLGRVGDGVRDLTSSLRLLLEVGQGYFALQCLQRLGAALAEDHAELAVTAQAILDADPGYRPDEFGAIVRDRYTASLPQRLGAERFVEAQRRGVELVEHAGQLGAARAFLDLLITDVPDEDPGTARPGRRARVAVVAPD